MNEIDYSKTLDELYNSINNITVPPLMRNQKPFIIFKNFIISLKGIETRLVAYIRKHAGEKVCAKPYMSMLLEQQIAPCDIVTKHGEPKPLKECLEVVVTDWEKKNTSQYKSIKIPSTDQTTTPYSTNVGSVNLYRGSSGD
jgi:hypothetical protein